MTMHLITAVPLVCIPWITLFLCRLETSSQENKNHDRSKIHFSLGCAVGKEEKITATNNRFLRKLDRSSLLIFQLLLLQKCLGIATE